MDQEVSPWSPIIARPVLRWPDHARVALAVLVNLEHWDWEVPPQTPLAVSPLGGPEGLWSGNQPAFPDIGGYGHHEYGNRVGLFHILAVLDKYGITPTLALDKAVADHYPVLIQEGQRRNAEFIAHGLSRRRLIHIGMSEAEERQYIRDAIAAVEQATGQRPVGWSGPDFQETPRTPNLLAAAGIRYVCDWGNDEQPYKMTPKTGELYSLGVHAYLDDNYIHLHGRRTINEVNRLWREWFDGLYADGATTGRVMVLHLHPWIMGQPWRIRHLDEVLGHITAHAGVWKATGREIIDWCTALQRAHTATEAPPTFFQVGFLPMLGPDLSLRPVLAHRASRPHPYGATVPDTSSSRTYSPAAPRCSLKKRTGSTIDRMRLGILRNPCPSSGNKIGSVSKVEMVTPMTLTCKVLFPSISTFETPPSPP